MKKPKVTVLTSLYNCRQYIEGYFQCIASIEYSDELEILLLHNAHTEEDIEKTCKLAGEALCSLDF